MKIKNKLAMQRTLTEMAGRNLQLACNSLVFELVTQELPTGLASPLATEIHVVRPKPNTVQIIITDPVWDYLSQGTGIYNPEHAGEGEDGAIVPVDPLVSALHFKDREIAIKLGMKGEDVFLKKVKGIKPRFYWDKYFNARRVQEKVERVRMEMTGIDIYSQ